MTVGWLPTHEFIRTIERATLYGCLYFTDERGWPLQLLSVYGKREWQCPGGNTDPGETPWETALRECREETGISYTGPQRLLATHFLGRDESWPLAKVGFVFDGGTLSAAAIEAIVLDPAEHEAVRVLPLDAWRPLLPAARYHQLAAADAARRSGHTAFVTA
ncbi:NUDIX domain-containing protein [Streptomyces sp. NPDC050560]|uniref:NUDIX domain-containing protein n=1 Tax=Streptomyces sp. NPDC050560 TaxID=3365630 RepID=UPI0037B3814B